MRKVHHSLERFSDPFKVGKLLAIVRGDRVKPILPGTECFNRGAGNFPGGFSHHFVHTRKSGFAIGQGDEKLPAPLTQDRTSRPPSCWCFSGVEPVTVDAFMLT